MEQINFQQPNFNHRKRRGGTLTVVFLALIVVIFFIASQVTNTIEIKNRSFWGRIITFWKPVEQERESLEDELNKTFPLPIPEENRLDILILGIRGSDDPDGGLLSDSIMLFSFDKTTGKTSLISIPRDLFVDLPGLVKGKANEVYERGLAKKDHTKFTKNAFSRITGIFIDNLVVFDFKGFKEIVNAINGIDINLKQPFEEKKQWGYEFALPAGKNHLDGETALYYARSRYGTNDFDRSRRQQEIILAIKERVLSLGILSNPLKVSSLLSSLNKNIDTDFNILDTKKLLDLALTLNSSSDKLRTKTMATDNILREEIRDDVYILIPRDDDWSVVKNYFLIF